MPIKNSANKIRVDSRITLGNLRSFGLVLNDTESNKQIKFDWDSDTWDNDANKPNLVVCVGGKSKVLNKNEYKYEKNKNVRTLSISCVVDYNTGDEDVRFYLFDKSIKFDLSENVIHYKQNKDLYPIGSKDAKYDFIFVSETTISEIKKSKGNTPLYFRPIGTLIMFEGHLQSEQSQMITIESDCIDTFGDISLANGFINDKSKETAINRYPFHKGEKTKSLYAIYALCKNVENGYIKISGYNGESATKTFVINDISAFGGKSVLLNNEIPDDNGKSADKQTYQIRFHSNNDANQMRVYNVENGGSLICPNVNDIFEAQENRASKGGWNYSPDRGGLIDVSPGKEITVEGKDIDLYAVWYIKDLSKEKQVGSSLYKNTVKFVDGINTPKDEEWLQVFGWSNSDSFGGKTVPWKEKYGFYDVTQGFYYMCWAASASNILHWWIDRNEENIKRYAKYSGPRKYSSNEDSEIFRYFRKYWPNSGNNTAQGFQWFLRGSDYRENGGFFSEVIKKQHHIFSVLRSNGKGIRKGDIAKFCENAIKNGDAMGLAMHNHQYTIWGVEFDSEGFVSGLFATNSNDTEYNKTIETKERIGLTYIDVSYDSNNYAITPSSIEGNYIVIGEMQSYSQCKEYWEEYFRNLR